MRLRFPLFVASSLFAVMAFGDPQQGPGHYYERPGLQEFSGEMIVRPLQSDALKAKGLGPVTIGIVQSRARQRILSYTKEYVQDTDEFIIIVPSGESENSLSAKLMKTGDYQYAEPNWICYPLRTPNDPQYGSQWHHPIVHSPEAWNIITGSATQIVAVVDTGIDTTHPDLAPNRVPGFNSVDRKAEVDGGQVNDINGHGTHVSGDAAAIGNNAVGVSGMGWNFRIMMIRTTNSPGGGASDADIMAGARWAADHGAKTISASYSGVDAATVGTTGTAIKQKGALFLYAAGNDNRNLSGFSWPDTIVVGASNEQDGKAGFSAYGRGVHVFAPGTNILSTTNGGGYGLASGTSMATPVCNGALALIWAASPNLSAQQAQDALESSCDNIGPSTIFGKGRINVFKGVLAAQSMAPVFIAPSAIETLEGTYQSGSLPGVASGGGNYIVASTTTQVGQIASVAVTYPSGTTPSRVLSLKFTFSATEIPASLVTGMMYAWNWNAGRWDMLSQFPLPAIGTALQEKLVSTNARNYVSSSGQVKARIRAVSTTRGGGLPPISYQLRLRLAKLAVASN